MASATSRNLSRDVDLVTMDRQFLIFLAAESHVLRPTVSYGVLSLDAIVAGGALSRNAHHAAETRPASNRQLGAGS
jgi:hypothetical protein